MRLNRDILITDIIRHQTVFFSLLDYIDKFDGALEIPENLYMRLYRDSIEKDQDQNVPTRLSIDSLTENGVFIHNDKNMGTITIEKVIVDVLRFLDTKRSKELTSVELEQLRKRTYSLTCDIRKMDSESDAFTDSMASLNLLLSEVHSKVKENVAGLHTQVGEIGKDYQSYDSGNGEVSVVDLYERVTHLYRKYVLPCYEFIDPALEMKQTLSFSQSMQSLIQYLAEDESMLSQSNRLQYRFSAISSYYKDLGGLVKRLEQFSSFLEHDRMQFIAVEKAFTTLMDNMTSLRHGMKKNRLLTPTSEFFKSLTIFDGLQSQKLKYSVKSNWDTHISAMKFKEFLSILSSKEIEKKSDINISQHSSLENRDEDRLKAISKLLFSSQLPEHVPDLHSFLFQKLKEQLQDFWLGDVLLGIQEIYPVIDDQNVAHTRDRERLEYGKYYLEYLVITTSKVQNYV